jgi:two-component system response regulator MtrA
VHVQRLRAKVEEDVDNPQVVLTVRGVGYKAGSN